MASIIEDVISVYNVLIFERRGLEPVGVNVQTFRRLKHGKGAVIGEYIQVSRRLEYGGGEIIGVDFQVSGHFG